jgi:hypothetical protein
VISALQHPRHYEINLSSEVVAHSSRNCATMWNIKKKEMEFLQILHKCVLY